MIKKIQSYFSELIPNGIIFIKTSAVAKNATALYIIQIAEYIIPLITVPYVVRIIGPAGFGEAAFCQGLVGYFALFIDYGFSMSATRSISVHREDKEKINRIFSNTIVTKTLLFVVGLILVFVLSLLSTKIHSQMYLILIAYLGLFGNVILPMWLFQGLEDMRFLSISNIVARILMVIGIFLLIDGNHGIAVYLLLLSSAQIFYGVSSLLKGMKQFRVSFRRVSLLDISNTLKEGWVLFLSNASVSLYSAGNPFILGFFASAQTVGYFAGAEKIIRAVIGLISPVSQAVYPRFSKLVVDSRSQFFILGKKLFFLMGSFGLMLSLITFVLAPVIIKTVLGDGFASSVVILRVLSLLPLVQSIVTVLGTQIMLPLGKDKDFTKIVFGSAIINFALVVLFARALGGVGSAVALVSAESYVMFMMFIFVIYKIRGKTDIASSREIRTTNQ